jgi:hypothetical protein
MIWMIRLMSNPDMTCYSRGPGLNFRDMCTAPDHRRAMQLRRLMSQGHAAHANDSEEKRE